MVSRQLRQYGGPADSKYTNFRDRTGMVHNRREFWERTFDDAYELAYQVWVIEGLHDAADLSEYLNAKSKAVPWRQEAEIIQKALLTDPEMKLVDNDHLIKRRNTGGEIADKVKFMGWSDGAPAKVESLSRLMPDATMALPIAMNIIDPESALSKNTLTELEKLWNERWFNGGYDRYNTSSQGDQPGRWICIIKK
jgi:GH15 family glucan-1,4-alpha-glucosidase